MNSASSKHGIILVDNVCIGYQLLTLMEKNGWKMSITNRDKQTYERILKGNIGTVIADIETSHLGGLAVLSYCKRHWPMITTYGIAPKTGEPYLKSLAQNLGGCSDFFYLSDGRLEIDTRTGMAAKLSTARNMSANRKKVPSIGKTPSSKASRSVS